jgi:hypothetical protein
MKARRHQGTSAAGKPWSGGPLSRSEPIGLQGFGSTRSALSDQRCRSQHEALRCSRSMLHQGGHWSHHAPDQHWEDGESDALRIIARQWAATLTPATASDIAAALLLARTLKGAGLVLERLARERAGWPDSGLEPGHGLGQRTPETDRADMPESDMPAP